jgi:hypothetical protein
MSLKNATPSFINPVTDEVTEILNISGKGYIHAVLNSSTSHGVTIICDGVSNTIGVPLPYNTVLLMYRFKESLIVKNYSTSTSYLFYSLD